MRTEQEYKNLEAERDALILAVADHVTVRSEQYAQIQALAARVAEMRKALANANAILPCGVRLIDGLEG